MAYNRKELCSFLFFFCEVNMKGCYYIGKKRKKRHPFLCFLLLLGVALVSFNTLLYPTAAELVKSKVENRISTLSAECITRVLSEEGANYSSLIQISYDGEGKVRSLSVDQVKIALLKQRVALSLLSVLKDESALAISVPLGNLTGLLPLSSIGRPISFSAKAAESLKASFVSTFEEAGINQTRHVISISYTFTVRILFGLKTETVTLSATLPAAETLIIGEVPDSLTQISRLTDGITEYDIDDAVDFGNAVGD